MKKKVFIFFAFLILLNYLSWGVLFSLRGAELEVVFIDVGQGDAVLIKTPQGHRILIDGGPGEVVLETLGREMLFYESIDLIVLTHPHYDHISGLVEVLRRYNVEEILYTGVREDSQVFHRWEEEVDSYRTARAGMRISANDFHMDILYPFESLEDEYIDDSNSTSIVSRFVFGDYSFLFTGDVYAAQEKEILSKKEWCKDNVDPVCRVMEVSSTVLKAGHHGSKTSTSEEFLLEVSPQMVIISAGTGNRYGHPHREVIDLLKMYGVTMKRTDRDGDIRVILP